MTLHSRLPAGERLRNWCDAATGNADLVLGTRLAVFTPLPRLGLIVVDEEHDPSFKQQEGVRYHGRDVAVWRARQRNVPVVLGSATPSLEIAGPRADAAAIAGSSCRGARWRRRALPTSGSSGNRDATAIEGIGAPLMAALATRLDRGEQSLVFINRRGFALSLLCSSCGWQAGCPRCSARLVVHRETADLRCHHCGHAERAARGRVPSAATSISCRSATARSGSSARSPTRFPGARIVRIDRDSTRRKGAFAGVRERVHAGEVDILVGTQMLAKGHDFPRLTLVGVLGADNALYSGDFRATERLAALLFQVSGRAGRADLPGEVIVQTDFPSHPLCARARRPRLRKLRGNAARGTARGDASAVRASRPAHRGSAAARSRRCVPRRGERARPQRGARGVGARRSVSRRCRRHCRDERDSSAGRCCAHAIERSAMQRFLPQWRAAIEALPGRRVRLALDVDPLGFA